MDKITELIQKNGWTQLEAAKQCSVTQPRINELLRGRISRFSLDALVNIAAHLGQRAHAELEAVLTGIKRLFWPVFRYVLGL